MQTEQAVRWRRRKDSRPQEILEAALDCFAERGFAATRLEDVAARAGVTKGTAYLYFKNKEELFKAVVSGYLVPAIEQFESAARASGPVSELLRSITGLFFEKVYNTRFSALPKLVIAEASNFPELARFYLDEVIDRGRRLLTTLHSARDRQRRIPRGGRRAHGLLHDRAVGVFGSLEALFRSVRREPPGRGRARALSCRLDPPWSRAGGARTPFAPRRPSRKSGRAKEEMRSPSIPE